MPEVNGRHQFGKRKVSVNAGGSAILPFVLFTGLFSFVHFLVFAQKSVPELWGLHVHDEAKVLAHETTDRLEKQLIAYEDSTSNQIAILIITSLDGEVLEEYALRVAEKWKLGQRDKDNGVLLLISVDDHKLRIEVGEGLEGVLTDAASNRIIRNVIAPNFRKDDYDAGVIAGVNAIISVIGGEYSADVDENSPELDWKFRLLLGAFVFVVLGAFTFLGLFIPGCGGWFLYAFLIPFYAVFPMVILGQNGGITVLSIYALAFPVLKLIIKKTSWGERIGKKMATSNTGGGWSSGSGWSGGGGGWSSGGGGGGFSGGGGSFGGGGSSGSW